MKCSETEVGGESLLTGRQCNSSNLSLKASFGLSNIMFVALVCCVDIHVVKARLFLSCSPLQHQLLGLKPTETVFFSW